MSGFDVHAGMRSRPLEKQEGTAIGSEIPYEPVPKMVMSDEWNPHWSTHDCRLLAYPMKALT